MKPIAFFLLMTGLLAPAYALDKAEIEQLVMKPHSREDLLPELRIFSDAREYEVELTLFPAEDDPVVIDPFKVREKIVDGKFVVTTSAQPGGGGNMVMVVTFDQKEDCYRKWVLLPDGTVGESVGISAKGSRAIAWVNKEAGLFSVLTLEQHTDNGATWTERHEIDGKVIVRQTGIARKLKTK